MFKTETDVFAISTYKTVPIFKKYNWICNFLEVILVIRLLLEIENTEEQKMLIKM